MHYLVVLHVPDGELLVLAVLNDLETATVTRQNLLSYLSGLGSVHVQTGCPLALFLERFCQLLAESLLLLDFDLDQSLLGVLLVVYVGLSQDSRDDLLVVSVENLMPEDVEVARLDHPVLVEVIHVKLANE